MITPEQQRDYDRTARNYERKVLSTYLHKETKVDKALRADMRDLWVRLCDLIVDHLRKITRVVHRAPFIRRIDG